MTTTILEDTREIKTISSALEDSHWCNWYEVGRDGIIKIVAYGEPGPHCLLPWFAVHDKDGIRHRVPAATFDVYYKVPE